MSRLWRGGVPKTFKGPNIKTPKLPDEPVVDKKPLPLVPKFFPSIEIPAKEDKDCSSDSDSDGDCDSEKSKCCKVVIINQGASISETQLTYSGAGVVSQSAASTSFTAGFAGSLVRTNFTPNTAETIAFRAPRSGNISNLWFYIDFVVNPTIVSATTTFTVQVYLANSPAATPSAPPFATFNSPLPTALASTVTVAPGTINVGQSIANNNSTDVVGVLAGQIIYLVLTVSGSIVSNFDLHAGYSYQYKITPVGI